MRIRFGKKRHGTDTARQQGGRIPLFIFGLLFFGVGTLFFAFSLRMTWQIVSSYSWQEHMCVVTASQIVDTHDRENPYRPEVRYRYTWTGQDLRSSRIRFSTPTYSSLIKAERFLERFSTGKKVRCLINPDNPAEAILERDSLWMGFLVLLSIPFILIGGGALFFAVKGPGAGDTSDDASSRGKKVKKTASRIPLTVVFLVLAVGGAFGTYYLSINVFAQYFAAQEWHPVPAQVEDSRIIESDGDDSTTYKGYIVYSYEFGGRTYRNDRRSFLDSSSSCFRCAREIVRKNPEGSTIQIWVDPAAPQRSVIERSFQWSYLLVGIPAAFFLIGVLGLFGKVGRREPGDDEAQTLASMGFYDTPELQQQQTRVEERAGLFILKPAVSSRGKFIAILLIALFWNGVIFLIATDGGFFSSFSVFSLLQNIVLVPFILIGLLLVAIALYVFFGMWSPTVELLLPQAQLDSGSTVTVRWRIPSSSSRVTSLRISLNAEEEIEVPSQHDRKKRTERRKVVYSELLSTHMAGSVPDQGEFRVAIPADCMPTFYTERARLTWQFVTEASIRGLPDVREKYEVQVGVAS